MILKELAFRLDRIFNIDLALDWDKVGLQIGNSGSNIEKVLLTVDVNRDVVNEAIEKGVDLIISHHPLIFNPVNTILSSNDTEKEILELVENKIAVYIAHTNYDLMDGGLADQLAEKIGLAETSKFGTVSRKWYKFVVFVPEEAEDKVRKAMCSHGGGKWHNYSGCTFSSRGKGTFTPMEGSDPHTGKVGKESFVDEVRIECIVDSVDLDGLIDAAIKAHPYEEAAYDVSRIRNRFEVGGMGRYGELEKPMTLEDFFRDIKERLGIDGFNWISGGMEDIGSTMVSRIAVGCGSANSLTSLFTGLDCDLVVVGEINYSNATRIVESGKILVALGHGVSESLSMDDMYSKLRAQKDMAEIDIDKSKTGFKSWRYYIG